MGWRSVPILLMPSLVSNECNKVIVVQSRPPFIRATALLCRGSERGEWLKIYHRLKGGPVVGCPNEPPRPYRTNGQR